MSGKSTTTTWWWCLDCGQEGQFEQSLSGGVAEKHTKDTGHGTFTSIRGSRPEGFATGAKRVYSRPSRAGERPARDDKGRLI